MNLTGCDDHITPTKPSSFYWYASPGSNAFGGTTTFSFSTDIPPNLITYDTPSNWSAAIVEVYAPKTEVISPNDVVIVHGPNVNVTLDFDFVNDAKQLTTAVNTALQNLHVTAVKLTANTNGTISVNIEDGFSMHLSGRLATITGFYEKHIFANSTSIGEFDAGRPFKTLRIVSNIFKETGGDFSPAPALWIHPGKVTNRVYHSPINPRYMPLSSWESSMTFSCLDISGEAIPITRSPDPVYIVLHFTRNT